MDYTDLEKLGLNKSEAKIYLGLLRLGKGTASELSKMLGIHRNIVYENLDKLIEKGIVSVLNLDGKRTFLAENSKAVIEYLDNQKTKIDEKMRLVHSLEPEINKLLQIRKTEDNVSLFRGIKAIKKILIEILESREYWVVGVSNDSVQILGETFWKNFNIKRESNKIKEHLLFNVDFKNIVNITSSKYSLKRILPTDLRQLTEIMLYDNKAVLIVYSLDPIAVMIDNRDIFNMYKVHFDFLWKLSKEQK